MNNTLAFDFIVDKASKTITIKREFAAEPALVWDAFTKKEILDQWWAPKPYKSETSSMEFKEGGYRYYAMVGPNGEKHWSSVKYESIKDHKQFICLNAFTDANGVTDPNMPKSQWEVNFTGKNDLTLVEIYIKFADLSHLEGHIKMGFKEGMTMCLDQLEELVSAR
jgi:uncharacterized protein YndB with AHSA1/START domain